MAFTESQLEALEKAYASGALSVRIGDKQVQYRSLSELATAIAAIKKQLGQTAAAPKRIQPPFNKGLC
jgi:hypothetical protein